LRDNSKGKIFKGVFSNEALPLLEEVGLSRRFFGLAEVAQANANQSEAL
jgi:hypothetical protein